MDRAASMMTVAADLDHFVVTDEMARHAQAGEKRKRLQHGDTDRSGLGPSWWGTISAWGGAPG